MLNNYFILLIAMLNSAHCCSKTFVGNIYFMISYVLYKLLKIYDYFLYSIETTYD